jgi:hypothetical protein
MQARFDRLEKTLGGIDAIRIVAAHLSGIRDEFGQELAELVFGYLCEGWCDAIERETKATPVGRHFRVVDAIRTLEEFRLSERARLAGTTVSEESLLLSTVLANREVCARLGAPSFKAMVTPASS